MTRYLTAAVAAALVAVFLLPTTAFAKKPVKVEVCHIGTTGPKTITVPEKVAQRHLANRLGDSLGACSEVPAAGCYSTTPAGGADLEYDGIEDTLNNLSAHFLIDESGAPAPGPCLGLLVGYRTLVITP